MIRLSARKHLSSQPKTHRLSTQNYWPLGPEHLCSQDKTPGFSGLGRYFANCVNWCAECSRLVNEHVTPILLFLNVLDRVDARSTPTVNGEFRNGLHPCFVERKSMPGQPPHSCSSLVLCFPLVGERVSSGTLCNMVYGRFIQGQLGRDPEVPLQKSGRNARFL